MSTTRSPSVLVLGLDPDIAAHISYRARSAGFAPYAPREDETALEAAFRLRPCAILVQVGRPELSGSSVESAAATLGASFIVFGDETLELYAIAKAHGGRTVSINASRREFGNALDSASGE